jgi:hypothetical protein
MESLTFLIWLLAAVGTIALLPWVIYVMLRISTATVASVGGAIANSFQAAADHKSLWRLRQAIADQIQQAAKSGRSRMWNKRHGNSDVYAMHIVLRNLIQSCNDIHHYAADALGVDQMSELEHHGVCATYRERVSGTIDVAVEKLMDSDVVADPVLAKMLIGLDGVGDICRDCELLKHQRSTLPSLCQPARYMGCSETNENTNEAKR